MRITVRNRLYTALPPEIFHIGRHFSGKSESYFLPGLHDPRRRRGTQEKCFLLKRSGKSHSGKFRHGCHIRIIIIFLHIFLLLYKISKYLSRQCYIINFFQKYKSLFRKRAKNCRSLCSETYCRKKEKMNETFFISNFCIPVRNIYPEGYSEIFLLPDFKFCLTFLQIMLY